MINQTVNTIDYNWIILMNILDPMSSSATTIHRNITLHIDEVQCLS